MLTFVSHSMYAEVVVLSATASRAAPKPERPFFVPEGQYGGGPMSPNRSMYRHSFAVESWGSRTPVS